MLAACMVMHGLGHVPFLKCSKRRVDAGASICDAGPEWGSNVFLWRLGTTSRGKVHQGSVPALKTVTVLGSRC